MTDEYYNIFDIRSQNDFISATKKVFDYQYNKNNLYHSFLKSLGNNNGQINSVYDIPFLPVEFFRNHKVLTGDFSVEMIFESSGTTGSFPGRHYVNSLQLYEESFTRAFSLFYGNPEDYLIAALLPSYTERENSSLVYMVDRLIKMSQNRKGGFYKDGFDSLLETIK